jgi:hypothetical protein
MGLSVMSRLLELVGEGVGKVVFLILIVSA